MYVLANNRRTGDSLFDHNASVYVGVESVVIVPPPLQENNNAFTSHFTLLMIRVLYFYVILVLHFNWVWYKKCLFNNR